PCFPSRRRWPGSFAERIPRPATGTAANQRLWLRACLPRPPRSASLSPLDRIRAVGPRARRVKGLVRRSARGEPEPMVASRRRVARAPRTAKGETPVADQLLPTTVVGSYPQPDWLVNRALLSKMVPRVRMVDIWRIPEPWLEQAQDDATILAIRDMEQAGIDILTDGEIRRESYSNSFATAPEGFDLSPPAPARTPPRPDAPVPPRAS